MKGQRKDDIDMKQHNHRRRRHRNQGSSDDDSISSKNSMNVVAPATTSFVVSWIHTVAIIGDSMYAVIGSFVLLLLAIMIAIWQQQHPTKGYHRYNDTTLLPMMDHNYRHNNNDSMSRRNGKSKIRGSQKHN